MVEVFKTNITDRGQAAMLVDRIHKAFIGYKANFDLEDCDNILRVELENGRVATSSLLCFLNDFGCTAEVLPDELPLHGQTPIKTI
jgi:hypothetical protein